MEDPFAKFSQESHLSRFQPTDQDVLGQVGKRIFQHESFDWGDRFLATAGPAPITDLLRLVRGLEAEVWILIVLVVEYPGREPGRYASPMIPWQELESCLLKYAPLIENDGRMCLWICEANQNWKVIYDRHELFYLYGDAEWFRDRLHVQGFQEGELKLFGPHYHSYLREYDAMADALLGRWDFQHTELLDGDEE